MTAIIFGGEEGFEPSVPVTQYARLAIGTDGFIRQEPVRFKRARTPSLPAIL
jgi:hypothetical protein